VGCAWIVRLKSSEFAPISIARIASFINSPALWPVIPIPSILELSLVISNFVFPFFSPIANALPLADQGKTALLYFFFLFIKSFSVYPTQAISGFVYITDGILNGSKKDFISAQWLRDTKHKKYPFWRLDTMFSKYKFSSIHYVKDGGWHFTNVKTPEEIEKKLSNFLHHQDFKSSGLNLDDIKKMVENNKVLYDHTVDQRDFKWSGNITLKKIPLSEMPDYLNKNVKKYSNWLET